MPSMHLSHIRNWILQSPPAEWVILQLRELLIGALRQGPVPQHVAFVMDGNRRFARSHLIETVEGHNMGFEALARILEVCYKSGVKVVTIYAFSIENFKRSKHEVDALMQMALVKLSQLIQHGDLLDRYGASIRFLGQRELLREDVQRAIKKAVEITKNNTNTILNVCVPYTSRAEIASAIRDTVIDYSKPLSTPQRPFTEARITHNIRNQHLATARIRSHSPSSRTASDTDDSTSSSPTLNADSPQELLLPSDGDDLKKSPASIYPDPETITPKVLDDHMFTAGAPSLDLLVRTSGVERLSDFMLWQCHQDTEIVFLKCLWPEFDLWTFLPILVEWQWRRRKFDERQMGVSISTVKKTKTG